MVTLVTGINGQIQSHICSALHKKTINAMNICMNVQTKLAQLSTI